MPIPYIAKPVASGRDAIACHRRWRITLLLATRMREPSTTLANALMALDRLQIALSA